MVKHTHNFEACGTDEQQCDNACQAEHRCGICKKSRSTIAKNVAEVKQHVDDSAEKIAQTIKDALNLPTLKSTVEALKKCAQELDWLTREQVVEMAVWEEKRATLR